MAFRLHSLSYERKEGSMDTFRWFSGVKDDVLCGFTEEEGGRETALEYLLSVTVPGLPLVWVDETTLKQVSPAGVEHFYVLFAD
jgi:hypothetical protein